MSTLSLVAGVDPRILKTEDLLRWGKPVTDLEIALFEALKRERQDAEPWEELAANYDCDTPAELEKLIDELKDNQKPDDHDDYVEFYEAVLAKFEESTFWAAAKPGDEGLQKAIIKELDLASRARSLIEEEA